MVALLGVLVCEAGAIVSPAVAADSSVTYQVNPLHSGAVTSDSLTPPLTKAWTRNLGVATVSYPLVVEGVVYVTAGTAGQTGSTLYALSATTGRTLWSRTLGGPYSFSAIAYDQGRIFIQTFGGTLQAVSAATGQSYWVAQLPYQWSFTSPPSARGGVVYTAGAGGGGTLYAVRESDGRLLWDVDVENGDHSSPAVSSTNVYVSYVGPQVYSFTLAGAFSWQFSGCCEGGGGTTPVLAGGKLYVRDPTSGDYVLSASSGRPVDTFASDTAPAFANGLGPYLVNHVLTATSTVTGTTTWRFRGDGGIVSAPIVINGYAYVGSSTGHVYAVKLSTGRGAVVATAPAAVTPPDENNAGILTGIGGGGGELVVPASGTITAYR